MKTAASRWQAAGLLALVIIAYLPALRAHWIWDDDYYVTNNVTLRSLDGLRRIWFELGAVPQYYPLVHTTFWVEHHFVQLNPLLYHLDNVLLQTMAALLVWLVLGRLNVPGAWIAAAIWAVHPIQVESVAWVTERKNVLSGVFFFASLLVYLRAFGVGGSGLGVRGSGFGEETEDAESKSLSKPSITPDYAGPRAEQVKAPFPWGGWALALMLFICALLSKTVACSMPAVVLLVIWWKRGRIRARDVWPLVPFFVIGAGMGALTGWMEQHFVGAVGPEWNISLATRCVIAGRALWFYLGRILCPWPLIFIYPRWKVNSMPLSWFIFPAAAIGAIVLLIAMRRRLGRGPATAALFFAGTLVPALGFVNTLPMRYSFVADHFQYIACLGIIALVVAIAARKIDRGPRIGVFSILLPCLVLLGWQRCAAFQNAEALWRDTLAKNPSAWMAHNNLGLILLKRNDLADAEAQFVRTIQLKSDHTEARLNLGLVAEKRGQLKLAEQWYRQAISYGSNNPDAHFDLGGVLAREGRMSDAVTELKRAIQLNPKMTAARENLAALYLRTGDYRYAEQAWRKVLGLDPGNIAASNDLGVSLAEQGKLTEALDALEKVIRIEPNFVEGHLNLGIVLEKLGRIDQARRQFQIVLKLDAHNARALARLRKLNRSAAMMVGKMPEPATIPSP